MAKSRFPKKHLITLSEICHSEGPSPRYVIAAKLRERIAPAINPSTALDYVQGAVAEGILVKLGENLKLKEDE